MSRVVVTGNSGFVGRVLVDRLVAEGHDVWGIDRTGGTDERAGTRYLSGDLTDELATKSLLDEAGPEVIIHLAAQSSVRRSFDAPYETIINNTMPTLHILDWMRNRSSCRLLAIGSADEYGKVDADSLPITEDHPVNPESPYALGKSIQNQYCRGYASLYGLDIVITRSFNHTGAGQRDAFVLPSFARQITEIKLEKREPVIEVGNLEVRRDFTDVRDVCSAYRALVRDGRRGEVYNVCSGQSYRIRDLLDTMCRLAGVDVEIRVNPERFRPSDLPELRGDNSKLSADTGWKPETPIEETLQSLLDYWQGLAEGTHGGTE